MEGNGYYKNGRNGRSGGFGDSGNSNSSFSTSMLASRSSSSSSLPSARFHGTTPMNSTFSSSYLQKRAQYPSPIPEEEKKHDSSSALERRKQRAKLLERNVERHQQQLSSTTATSTSPTIASATATADATAASFSSPASTTTKTTSLGIPANLHSSLKNSMSSTGTVAPEPEPSRRKSKSKSKSSSRHSSSSSSKEVWGAKSPKRKSKRSKDSSKKKTPGRRPDQDGDDDHQSDEPPSLSMEQASHFQEFGTFGESEQEQQQSSSSSSSSRFGTRRTNKERPWMQDTKGTRRVSSGRLSGQHKPLKRKSRNAWRSLLQSGGSGGGGLHQYIRNKQQQNAHNAYSPYDEAFGLCPSIIEEEEDEEVDDSASPEAEASKKALLKTNHTDAQNTTTDDDDDDDDNNPQLTDEDDAGTTHLLSAVQEGMELSSLGNISDDAHLTDEDLHTSGRSKSPARGMHRTFSASSGGSTTSSATSASNPQNSTTNIVQQGRALAASLRANYLQTQQKERMRQEEWEKERQEYLEQEKRQFMQGLSGSLKDTVNQGNFEVVESVATGHYNPERIKNAFPVEELKDRIGQLFTGDHKIVEGIGKGGVISPQEKRRRDRMAIERETRELARIQLALALKARFEQHNRFYGITTDGDDNNANNEEDNQEPESSEQQTENPSSEQEQGPKQASDNEQSDEEGESDEEDDVSVLSMGEQSVATVQSFIVAATILNKERQKGASGEESNNLNTTLSQDDDDEWDEFTVETSRESVFASMNNKSVEQEPSSSNEQGTAKMSLGNFLDQRPEQSEASKEHELPLLPDDDEVSEYTLETYYSKQTFSQNVTQADSGFTAQQRKGMSVESLFNPLAMTPPPNAHCDADGNDNPPPMPQWDASAAESIADALLSIPGALMGVPPPRVRGAMSVRGGDEVSVYDEMTYVSGEGDDDEDFEEETYFSNGEEDYDEDDDYWDDQTIQTVADAFVSLPRNIQLEFLATSQAANDADDASEASSRAPNPEDFMEKDKTWTSSGNTVATTSESESHLGEQATPKIPAEARTLEELLKKGLVSRDKMFVESSLCELAVKMEEDKDYRAKVAEAGGILAIVRSMEQNVENPDAQVYASHCLESLSIDSENRESIGEVGGIEAVVGALANHMSVARVAEVACGCILTLTNQVPNCAVEVAAVDVIVSAMKTHSKNKIIQEKAFQALTRLCLSDKNKLIALSQFGGFSVMSQSLSIHWDEPSVKGQAIFTMAELFNKLAEYQANGEL